jgi:hypothetical protein
VIIEVFQFIHDDLALCSIKNNNVPCRVYRTAEMLDSMPIYHFALRGGLCSCLDSERGTLTCLVLVPRGLVARCVPAIISIQFLSCDSSPTPADISLTVQFSQVKCPHLEQLVLEASALHLQQRKVTSISLWALEDARGNVEEWSADVG